MYATRIDYRVPPPATWDEVKQQHNPPGMWTGFTRRLRDMSIADTRVGVGHYELSVSKVVKYDESEEEGRNEEWRRVARADAWEHYDRRLAVANRLDACGLAPICTRPLWPRILTWPDHLVAHAEAYLDNDDPSPWSDAHENAGMFRPEIE
jgi:hypothetical protein